MHIFQLFERLSQPFIAANRTGDSGIPRKIHGHSRPRANVHSPASDAAKWQTLPGAISRPLPILGGKMQTLEDGVSHELERLQLLRQLQAGPARLMPTA